jgi:hypothetical protein
MFRVLLYVVPIAIVLYAFFDCASTPQENVRNAPKWAWLLLILIFDLIGALAWFFLGRPKSGAGGGRTPRKRGPIAPDDDPDFLRKL